MTNRVRVIVGASAFLVTACKGKEPVGPPAVGPPTQVVEVSPVSRTAMANTVVASPITVAVQDANGHGIAGQVVTFSVVAGGGSLTGNLVDTTDANGHATAPSWKLGKSADGAGAQKLKAESGTTTPVEISATVLTSYNIVVRFFGTAMTSQQQALFTTAAQRIMGVVTGDMINIPIQTDISSCLGQSPGTTTINETIDDIVIYAQAKAIDGANQVLGSAGPCYIRQGEGCAAGCDKIPLLGVMTFDIADLGNGGLPTVIQHEMLHVLGLGSLWGASYFNFVTGAGSLDPRYTAAEARANCVAFGGTVACQNTVPVEGCADIPECRPTVEEPNKGSGTRDSHWREQNFNTELMTGIIDNGVNPFSTLTIGGLKDMGYAVNAGDSDDYTIFANLLLANVMAEPTSSPFAKNWEGRHTAPVYSVELGGAVKLWRKGQ